MAGTKRIVIPYSPRQQFVSFHARTQRWACVVSHVRAGKTVACINELIRGALMCRLPEPRFAYLAPYYGQAKDVAWNYLKRFTAPIPGVQVNEAELRVDLPNGGRIRLYGADNYDRMRGIYLDGVVLDEPADMHPAAWPEVIRPRLSDRGGWAAFIGTPKGRNEFFRIREEARGNPEWFYLELKASQTGILPAEELENAKRAMTPEQYAQEYETSFDAAIIGSYFGSLIADAEAQGQVGSLEVDPIAPVHTAWDLGIGDATAIWFFQVAPDGLRVIDYFEDVGQGLGRYVTELEAKGYRYGDDWVPHDAKVRELGTGRTRIETLLSMKRKPRVVPDHKIMDGINAVRVSLPKIWIDADRCKLGLEAIRQYKADFDDKKKAFKDQPRHDWTSHAADAFRYMCMAWREMLPKPEPKPFKMQTRWPTMKELTDEHDRRAKLKRPRI